MNLVFIYGPPASGKLTISTELAQLTGYTLFHNHLTRDFVEGLYPDDLLEKYDLVENIRLEVFRFAAEHGTDLIFTFVHDSAGEDEAFVEKVVNTVELYGGRVCFVEATAPSEVLLSRVEDESRKDHGKLTKPAVLKLHLDNGAFGSVNRPGVLKLDTAKNDAVASARIITDYYHLRTRQ